jgi:hypothetical protein
MSVLNIKPVSERDAGGLAQVRVVPVVWYGLRTSSARDGQLAGD